MDEEKKNKLIKFGTSITLFLFAYIELWGAIYCLFFPEIAASYIQGEFSESLIITGSFSLIVASLRIIMGILNLKNQKYAAIIILGFPLSPRRPVPVPLEHPGTSGC